MTGEGSGWRRRWLRYDSVQRQMMVCLECGVWCGVGGGGGVVGRVGRGEMEWGWVVWGGTGGVVWGRVGWDRK